MFTLTFFFIRCLEHVVNLANGDVMDHITKIGSMENVATIWKYDPHDPDNHVMDGKDVVCGLWTLAVKVGLLMFWCLLVT